MKLTRHPIRFNNNQRAHRSLPRRAAAAEQRAVMEEISRNIHHLHSRANNQKLQAVNDASQEQLRRANELRGLSQTFGQPLPAIQQKRHNGASVF